MYLNSTFLTPSTSNSCLCVINNRLPRLARYLQAVFIVTNSFGSLKGPLKYLVAKLHGCYPATNSLPVSQNFFAGFFRRRPVADSSRCLTFLLRCNKHKLLVEGVKKVEFEYINYLSREEKKVMKSGEKHQYEL